MNSFNGNLTPEFCAYVESNGSGGSVDTLYKLQEIEEFECDCDCEYDDECICSEPLIYPDAIGSLNALWIEYQGAQARGEVK